MAQTDSTQYLEIDFKDFLAPSFPDRGMYKITEEYQDRAGLLHRHNFKLFVTQNEHSRSKAGFFWNVLPWLTLLKVGQVK